MIVKLKDLQSDVPHTYLGAPFSSWAPARPLNWKCRTLLQRFKEAYMVFMGKADPFVWPEDE